MLRHIIVVEYKCQSTKKNCEKQASPESHSYLTNLSSYLVFLFCPGGTWWVGSQCVPETEIRTGESDSLAVYFSEGKSHTSGLWWGCWGAHMGKGETALEKSLEN